MTKKGFGIIGLFIIVLPAFLQAQERLTGLFYNNTVHQAWLQQKNKPRFKTDETETNYLSLPFFDNFKTPAPFPDSRRWVEKAVFVNTGFGYLPPDQGVATFDALDSTGSIYGNAISVPFRADHLTSQPLRLDSVFSPVPRKLTPADSVYLSFYYQPQGYGDAPEKGDSLILVFHELTGDTVFSRIDSVWVSANLYLKSPQDTIFPLDTLRGISPCDTNFYLINYQTLVWGDSLLFPCDSVFAPEKRWVKVWSSPGMTLEQFKEEYGKDFVQVLIPLSQSSCFYKGFQFQFYNKASIANSITPVWQSNVDEWNVDDIYLNAGRSAKDTTYRAIAFSGTHPNFLKRYTEMPYRQYRSDPTNSLTPDFHVYIANRDNQPHDIHYFYQVHQVNGNFGYGYDGGTCVLNPFYEAGFQDCNTSCGAAQACPPVNSLFSLDYDRDTTSYIIKHYISDSSVSPPLVDSMVYRQGFYNEYAYDDGTPELGYSLEPAGAELAYRFQLKIADTLQAVRIYFNKTKSSPTRLFDLMIWRDNNGKPGEVIYKQVNQQVHWEDGLYPFTTYKLDTPVLVSGTIYVGYRQQDQSLNVGFDANHDAGEDIFYFSEGAWYQTKFKGALLIRPVVGQNMILGIPSQSTNTETCSVYPNPVRSQLHFAGILIDPQHPAIVNVYDLFGRKIIPQINMTTPSLNVSFLPDGMYLLQLQYGIKNYTIKFIVRH